jgi:hypothetical protein
MAFLETAIPEGRLAPCVAGATRAGFGGGFPALKRRGRLSASLPRLRTDMSGFAPVRWLVGQGLASYLAEEEAWNSILP